MKAVLSGRACVALLIDGDLLRSIHYEEMDRLVPRKPEEFELLFGGAGDLDFVDDVASIDEIRDRLADAVDSTEALNLVLYLCDDRLSSGTLESAAAELEEVIAYPEIAVSLEQILFANPLPSSVDLEAGLAACRVMNCNSAESFPNRLLDLQETIMIIRSAWISILDEKFGDVRRESSEAVCLRHSLFRDLVNELAKSGTTAMIQSYASSNSSLLNDSPHIVELLSSWEQAIVSCHQRPGLQTAEGLGLRIVPPTPPNDEKLVQRAG